MLNFSFPELLVVGGVALIVLGPDRLPEIAYQLGRFMRGIHRINEKIKSEMDTQLKQENLQRNIQRAEAVEMLRDGHD